MLEHIMVRSHKIAAAYWRRHWSSASLNELHADLAEKPEDPTFAPVLKPTTLVDDGPQFAHLIVDVLHGCSICHHTDCAFVCCPPVDGTHDAQLSQGGKYHCHVC